jgi:hypothetical protein
MCHDMCLQGAVVDRVDRCRLSKALRQVAKVFSYSLLSYQIDLHISCG